MGPAGLRNYQNDWFWFIAEMRMHFKKMRCVFFYIQVRLYCIVLYLYIYIALPVHINQKRFQCERPREKRSWENENGHLAHQLIKWIS